MMKNKKMKLNYLLAALATFAAAMTAPLALPATGMTLSAVLSLASLIMLYAAFKGVGKEVNAKSLSAMAAKAGTLNLEIDDYDDRTAIEKVFPEFPGNPGMAPGDRNN